MVPEKETSWHERELSREPGKKGLMQTLLERVDRGRLEKRYLCRRAWFAESGPFVNGQTKFRCAA
jgi:hypothetical protein